MRLGIIAVCLGTLLWSGPVWSHEARFGLGGKELILKTKPGQATFRFIARGAGLSLFGHDPSTAESWLLVRGVGETPGTTGKIVLDPSRWRPIGKSAKPAPCTPTHCTAGRLGAACGGAADHATCDSTPGAGDGLCDACPITAGVTTQDEMFILSGWSYDAGP